MASGTIKLNTNKSNLEGRINWQSTSNGSSANSSNVYAEIQVRRNDGYTTKGTWSGLLNINENKQEYSNSSTSVGSSWVTMKAFSVNNIAHNNEGAGSCWISGWCNGPSGTSMAGATVEGGATITLDKIARKSSVTCADGNIGSATTININRASSSFTHTLKYTFGSLSGTIVTKTSNTSIGWTIPTSFYGQLPNAKSGQGMITCETYDGDTLIGSATCNFYAVVLESINKPSVSATIVDSNATTKALTGDQNKLVKYFSTAKVDIKATAKNSATIKSQKVTCGDGQFKTTASSTISNVASGNFAISATDSRGFVTNIAVNKTLINYIKLAITSLVVERESSTSNTIKISLKGNYFNSSFGAVANTLALKWRYRLQGGTWSGYTAVNATKSGNTFSYSGTLGTNFDCQKAYEFEVLAQDKLMSTPIKRPVTAGIPLFDIWKGNFKVNGTIHAENINCYKTLNGGNGNTTGYRVVLQQKLTTWTQYRMVLAVASRHQGSGLITFSISIKGNINEFEVDGRYYGTDTEFEENSWVQCYNPQSGVYTLLWRYRDYSNCSIRLLNKLRFGRSF